jgi:hypothetical protein
MTTLKQIAANRRNAAKSTGPTTEEGKQRSRCNALRHGLTAETVICTLEHVEDYRAFEAAITADYDAQSAVERELVLRLASLLWRLRRSTAIETGLYKIRTEHMRKQNYQVYLALRGSSERYGQASPEPDYTGPPPWFAFDKAATADVATDLSHCFLRLSNIPNSVLDRLGRYETVLWRQVGQTLLTLDRLDRRKPQERAGQFRILSRQRASDLTDEN